MNLDDDFNLSGFNFNDLSSDELSRDLSASYDRGELDLMLLKQRQNAREAVACWPQKTRWVDSAKNACIELDPVPIVPFHRAGCTAMR